MSRFGQIARDLSRFIPAEAVRPLGRPSAVFFHGVEHTTLDPRLQTNHHEAEDFLAIARNLKANFDVLPLAALDDVLKRPDRHPRAVFLMSDDGYANTLSVAADMLEELELPWTLFASTHHIDTGERNPVFLARLFVYHAPAGRYAIAHLPQALVLGSGRDAIADRLVWQLRGLDMVRAQQAVDAMMAALEPALLRKLLAKFSSERFLDWDQVRQLARRGVAIGAHAHHHWPMNEHQSPALLRGQAVQAKARIEREVGPCHYFAYPFGNKGDISRDAWHAVRDAGYDCAFTTLSGSLDAQANRFLLPRYGIEPQAPHLTTLISMLRAGNPRVARWQKELAD
ncbi:MAG TPA: polysaccharide deacetylase family protein [Rhizomicrobium sp.]|jgi:peptidoglycan/xylan/chitin deacetylase (PgdA/CDA1 family)|nr:polysaccharide deacetylase family protein [Rhizomicrobium sp.]